MGRSDILISLFFETLLPFLQKKVEQYVAAKLGKRDDHEPRDTKRRALLKWIVRLYSLVSRVAKLLVFVHSFRYLISPTFAFYKPYYQWFSLHIRRLNQFEQGEELKKPLLSRLLSQYNIFLLFLFKTYCEWYFGARMQQIQAQETADRVNSKANSLVKAPVLSKKSDRDLGSCAICKAKPMVHPCVLETSGFAFCYPCASAHI